MKHLLFILLIAALLSYNDSFAQNFNNGNEEVTVHATIQPRNYDYQANLLETSWNNYATTSASFEEKTPLLPSANQEQREEVRIIAFNGDCERIHPESGTLLEDWGEVNVYLSKRVPPFRLDLVFDIDIVSLETSGLPELIKVYKSSNQKNVVYVDISDYYSGPWGTVKFGIGFNDIRVIIALDIPNELPRP